MLTRAGGLDANGIDTRPIQQTVLMVDDEPTNLQLLETILKQRPHVRSIALSDPRKAVETIMSMRPDLLLLDLNMPGVSGYDILARLAAELPPAEYLPVLVLTAESGREALRRSLAMGATDFVAKPFDPKEFLLRIDNLLRSREMHLRLLANQQELEARVARRTEQLEHAKLEILERLARTTELRDDDTGQHIRRIGANASQVWTALGLDAKQAGIIELAAPLHDVGKVGIADEILLKPGGLTEAEFESMKTHTLIGEAILSGSDFDVLRVGASIARSHHERWDGSGYPDGLSGADIPIEARIVLVCDVFDALTHERPYKAAWPVQRALDCIAADAGTVSDPTVAAKFLELAGQAGKLHV